MLASGVADTVGKAEGGNPRGPHRDAASLLPARAVLPRAHGGASHTPEEARIMLTRLLTAKKTIRPHQLGHVLYQVLHTDVASGSASSRSALLDRLALTDAELVGGYHTEILFSVMSQAQWAVEHTYARPVAGAIVDGMTAAFVAHTTAMGATPEHAATCVSLFAVRAQEYAQAANHHLFYDQAYWRGKVFLEKMTGEKHAPGDPRTPLHVAICSSFLTASCVAIHTVVDQYRIAA